MKIPEAMAGVCKWLIMAILLPFVLIGMVLAVVVIGVAAGMVLFCMAFKALTE